MPLNLTTSIDQAIVMTDTTTGAVSTITHLGRGKFRIDAPKHVRVSRGPKSVERQIAAALRDREASR